MATAHDELYLRYLVNNSERWARLMREDAAFAESRAIGLEAGRDALARWGADGPGPDRVVGTVGPADFETVCDWGLSRFAGNSSVIGFEDAVPGGLGVGHGLVVIPIASFRNLLRRQLDVAGYASVLTCGPDAQWFTVDMCDETDVCLDESPEFVAQLRVPDPATEGDW